MLEGAAQGRVVWVVCSSSSREHLKVAALTDITVGLPRENHTKRTLCVLAVLPTRKVSNRECRVVYGDRKIRGDPFFPLISRLD